MVVLLLVIGGLIAAGTLLLWAEYKGWITYEDDDHEL